jgi:hypothetical protein
MYPNGPVVLSLFLSDQKSDPKNRRLRIIKPVSDCVRDKFDGPSLSCFLLPSNRYEFITHRPCLLPDYSLGRGKPGPNVQSCRFFCPPYGRMRTLTPTLSKGAKGTTCPVIFKSSI